MKKYFGLLVGVLLIVSCASASTFSDLADTDGTVQLDQGYFVGTFAKEIETGKVWKVVKVTDTAVYITEFETGIVAQDEEYTDEEGHALEDLRGEK